MDKDKVENHKFALTKQSLIMNLSLGYEIYICETEALVPNKF